jgi:integrase
MVDALWNRWRAHYAPSTSYIRSCIFRRLLKALQQFGAPPLNIPRQRKPQPRSVIATPEKVQALLRQAKPPMRLFILLCWQMALRFSEALAVTPNSFNPEDHTVTIRTKGGKVRTIEATRDVYDMLIVAKEAAGDPGQSCIAILNGGKEISPGGIRSMWWKHTKAAGVTELHPHDLRRTTATNIYRATHDLRAVQQYLGHDNMASTVHYIAPLAREELAGLHRLLNFHSEVKQ